MSNSETNNKFHFGRNLFTFITIILGILILIFIVFSVNGCQNIQKHHVKAFIDGSPNTTASSVDYSNYGLFDENNITYIDEASYDTFAVTLTCTDWNRQADKANFTIKLELLDTKPYLYTTSLDTSYTILIEMCIASKINTYTTYSTLKKLKLASDYNDGKVTTTAYLEGIDIYPRSVYEFPFFFINEPEPTVYLNIFYYTNSATYHNDCLVYDYKDFEVQSGGIAK